MSELVSDEDIIYFCGGVGENCKRKPRCDSFFQDAGGKPSCQVNPKLQGGRAFLEWCEVASRDGIPGHLDDYGFYPTQIQKR